MRAQFPCIEQAFRLDDGPGVDGLEPAAAMLALAMAPKGADDYAARRHAVQGADAAAIVYTSGSSGAPKGAVLPHRSLVYGPRVEAEQNAILQPRVLCNFPINHVACIGDTCASTLIAGGMLAFDERFDPGHYLALVERLRLTQLAHVPTVLQMLLAHPDFAKRDLSSVQLVAWGGAALPISAVRTFRARGLRMISLYGLTETVCNVTWADERSSDEVLATTIGRPDPNVALKLLDEQCIEVTDGEPGEIVVRHDALMLGYFNRPEATAASLTPDGYLRTGDLAVRLPDGNYRIVGRRSEMYKSGGCKVYPREVEICLEEHPAVASAAVVGVPDPVYQEIGVAWLSARPGAQAVDADTMRAWCRERLANYKIPKRFEWREHLPLLPVGKVDKQALKRQATAVR
jgi:acyl-CoA synthetase (AMP-forming)/AMP-acid ligase II